MLPLFLPAAISPDEFKSENEFGFDFRKRLIEFRKIIEKHLDDVVEI